MSDAASERSNRIRTEYLKYLKLQVAKEAEKRLIDIFRSGGDADKKASSAVRIQLGTYPKPINTTDSTPAETSAVMADNARNDTMVVSSEKYRKHWIATLNKLEFRLMDNPAAYIAKCAVHACIKQMGTENSRGKRIRVWYNEALSDPRFVSAHSTNLFGRQTETNMVGLKSWPQMVDGKKTSRVRELMEHPDDVRTQEHFSVSIVRTKGDLIDMMEEALSWCGTAVSASDLLTQVVLPWCKINVSAFDDDVSHERERAHERPRDAEREAIAQMTLRALFDLMDDPQNEEILRLFFFEGLKQKEIAEELNSAKNLNLSEDAVQKRIERALKTLHRKGTKAGLDDGNDQKAAVTKVSDRAAK